MAPTVRADRLTHRVPGLDAEWIAGQRWFRAKTRRVGEVTLHDSAELPDGAGWLLVLGVGYQEGGGDRYLVPAVADGDVFREPQDGEGTWRTLAATIAAGAELASRGGRFASEPSAALSDLLPGGAAEAAALDERRLAVEQSNSSAILGDRLFLKLYRLLEPGINPEVEVSAFLTAAGFRHAPVLAGSSRYLPDGGEPSAAVLLQGLVHARGDAWSWMLGRLAAGFDGAAEGVAGAAQIAGVTAELHAALASNPDAPGFPVRAATADERAAWRVSAEAQLAGAIEALAGEERLRLEELAPRVADRLAAMDEAGEVRVTRIHGDYHLGQLLTTEGGFAVIDFEGEPARPLAERRRPGSPLRDLAGMLRSLDYAARTAQRNGAMALEPDGWLLDARAAFLSTYGELPPGGEDLLAAFELEKACYEVRYEANNRPDWTWLPLAALERLAA
jgi:trehalose synthase-fused probable maltokinase